MHNLFLDSFNVFLKEGGVAENWKKISEQEKSEWQARADDIEECVDVNKWTDAERSMFLKKSVESMNRICKNMNAIFGTEILCHVSACEDFEGFNMIACGEKVSELFLSNQEEKSRALLYNYQSLVDSVKQPIFYKKETKAQLVS